MERRSQHLSLVASGVLFLVLIVLSFWQTSLDFGSFRPSGATATSVLWGMSTLIVLGVFTLGFILFRSLLKLYLEQRQNKLGSKIKTKLVVGALALSFVPVVAMVLFSFTTLNRTLDKWFGYPTRQVVRNSTDVAAQINEMMRSRTESDASWTASLPEAVAVLDPSAQGLAATGSLHRAMSRLGANYVAVRDMSQSVKVFVRSDAEDDAAMWSPPAEPSEALIQASAEDGSGVLSGFDGQYVWASAPIAIDGAAVGEAIVAWRVPTAIEQGLTAIQLASEEWAELHEVWRDGRYFYLGMMALITIFTLFVATWLSLFFSKQIIVPIEALVEATGEVSSGHLSYRVETRAVDELGGLVHSFNEMTQRLETQTRRLQESNVQLEKANDEIDARRRYINAILESITPGVLSIDAEGKILRANSSARRIFGLNGGMRPRFEELLTPDDAGDLRYMLNRARRTGLVSREFEYRSEGQIMHLSVAVTALDNPASKATQRFVVVVEDATELLRAQKSAAWNEVARRVAHEIKNPLTPIALSAERMGRLLDRYEASDDPEEQRELRTRFRGAAGVISAEVQTLRSLVDEFSQFARFPKSNPERADLNQVVSEAVAVFDGRLDGVKLDVETDPRLPEVLIDHAQFKRAVVNLIDNAAEALSDGWLKEIHVRTAPGALPDTVELTIEDSGPGVSAEDKEKLFLPYFSTKKRGTGLGLAIVGRIVGEHGGAIRVEDNRPSGARFIIELPAAESIVPQPTGVGT